MSLRHTLAPFGLGLLVALALALLLAVGWLGVRGRDMIDLTRYLLFSGTISLGLGGLGLLWFRRGPAKLWLQVTLTCVLGLAVAMINIFVTAQLMFISNDHDLPLLVLLMLFAAVVSLALGFALARTLAQRVAVLQRGAQAIADGDLSVRVDATGRDELAELAAKFNTMAVQLAAAAAERARLESARRELVAAISHDLRTPLTSLRVIAEALADGVVDDPTTAARYLSSMRGQIAHLSSLIDDLFELAQIDAGALRLELQRASLPELVENAIVGLVPQAEAKGVRLAATIADGVQPLALAPQQIGRVLDNLLANAIRHTPAGGSVTVAVAPGQANIGIEPGAEASITQNSRLKTQSYLLVEVADTGEGIAPHDLPRIFEHFYRGEKSRSRATGGTGLGLAIARGIVEAHGGRIWAESPAGQGARVCFALPCAEEPSG